MLFLLLCLAIVCVCATSDVLSIQWRLACDASRMHRAAAISALMYGLGLLDLLLVVHDWKFIFPVLIGEVSGSYFGIWVKDHYGIKDSPTELPVAEVNERHLRAVP